ncbi:proproteinase E, putative, partial [Ixodes scapularis]
NDVEARAQGPQAQIINGEDGVPHEFPWLVALQKKNKDGWQQWCGSSLINNQWVATAAHCLFGDLNPSSYTIVIGEYNTEQPDPVQNGPDSTILQKVDLPTVPHDICKENYANSNPVIEETMICAGYEEGGKSMCNATCGVRGPSAQITGGDDAGAHEFPWMVSLKIYVGITETQFTCGGSIINEWYIITAAHCVQQWV